MDSSMATEARTCASPLVNTRTSESSLSAGTNVAPAKRRRSTNELGVASICGGGGVTSAIVIRRES
jgi:hypothetical protein